MHNIELYRYFLMEQNMLIREYHYPYKEIK